MLHWLDTAIKNKTIKKATILYNGKEQLQDTFFPVISITTKAQSSAILLNVSKFLRTLLIYWTMISSLKSTT